MTVWDVVCFQTTENRIRFSNRSGSTPNISSEMGMHCVGCASAHVYRVCCVLYYIFCVLSSIGCYVNDLVHASVAQIEFGCGSNNRLHFRGRSSTSCLLSFLLCGVHYLFITQPITFRLCYSFSHSERNVHRDLILSFQMRR